MGEGTRERIMGKNGGTSHLLDSSDVPFDGDVAVRRHPDVHIDRDCLRGCLSLRLSLVDHHVQMDHHAKLDDFLDGRRHGRRRVALEALDGGEARGLRSLQRLRRESSDVCRLSVHVLVAVEDARFPHLLCHVFQPEPTCLKRHLVPANDSGGGLVSSKQSSS